MTEGQPDGTGKAWPWQAEDRRCAVGFGAPNRRQAVNDMYMFEGVHFISEAAAEIPDGDLLWYSDDATQAAKSKNGILEQLGRMVVQDHFSGVYCIYVAYLAIAALKSGSTSREIEKEIRYPKQSRTMNG